MNKEKLFETFDKAREEHAPFVFVEIHAVDAEEVIVIPAKSFDAKEQFYDKAYGDDLVHVMNSNVFIKGFSYGTSEELDRLV